MTGSVLLHREAGVARIVIDRPRSRNALTAEMTRRLTEIVASLAGDTTVSAVAITAAGSDFCAGSDMGDIAAALSPDPAERASSFTTGLPDTIHPLMHALLALPQPVVAAVRGHAIGVGVAIALAADLLVVSETARFMVPQVRLGHTVDHGESWLLPRRVGVAQAARMSLLGEPLTGAQAHRHGMAGWLVGGGRRPRESVAADPRSVARPARTGRGGDQALARLLTRRVAGRSTRPRGSRVGSVRSDRRVHGRNHRGSGAYSATIYLISTARPRTSPRARSSKACKASLNG